MPSLAGMEHLCSTMLSWVSKRSKPIPKHQTPTGAFLKEISWFGEINDRDEMKYTLFFV